MLNLGFACVYCWVNYCLITYVLVGLLTRGVVWLFLLCSFVFCHSTITPNTPREPEEMGGWVGWMEWIKKGVSRWKFIIAVSIGQYILLTITCRRVCPAVYGSAGIDRLICQK